MVDYDVSEKTPGILLVARLHVDLCRLASAMCTPAAPPRQRLVSRFPTAAR
ncbi:MAG: hypothetical protein JO362_18710 [Streptomycetaceae bacterium]|nr:hypothetical protein [Streptomycetaceae bacterium]